MHKLSVSRNRSILFIVLIYLVIEVLCFGILLLSEESPVTFVYHVDQPCTHWLKRNCLRNKLCSCVNIAFTSVKTEWYNFKHKGHYKACYHVNKWDELEGALWLDKCKADQVREESMSRSKQRQKFNHWPDFGLKCSKFQRVDEQNHKWGLQEITT